MGRTSRGLTLDTWVASPGVWLRWPESMLISPRMLKTLKELDTLSSEAKATAFQHLLLLVGIHLFKVRRPEVEGAFRPRVCRGQELLCGAERDRFPRLTAPGWKYSPREKPLHPLTGHQLYPGLPWWLRQ